MSAIFISHSSADNAVAVTLQALLAARGHRSVFLDFDPQRGIPAGRQWERELYAQLRGCQAVVVLCSASFAASAWCFAELTQARALGKPLFPVKVDDQPLSSLLGDVQAIDLAPDQAAAWARLLDGLAGAGLDPSAPTNWDGSRPPYPGLMAFQKADAAVYFGRDAAIQSTLETLNRLRRLGGARLLLLLGASGSGKSSMVRAGVVPRLEHDSANWCVAAPFRPLSRPIDALALALSGLPGAGDWKAIRQVLDADAQGQSSGNWRDTVNSVRSRVGVEVSILIVVDQFEEALGSPPDDSPGDTGPLQAGFLRLLRAMTAKPDSPLFVIATLRSDFLGAFQTHPELQGVVYEPIHLAQIALSDIGQVIEGPARVAGIELEPGLAQAMVADTATDDALPLLAFTLRELYDRFGAGLRQGGRLTLAQYRDQLGGLQGALARSAEALCAPADDSANASGDALQALRRALLKLVRIDAEGRFVRQPRAWGELPADVHPVLERFVQARLLVSRSEDGGQRMLEVAHEALFRSWERLAGWLAADRSFLVWRERLRGLGDEWQRSGRDAGLLLRGPVLAEAQRWLGERGHDMDGTARDLIVASMAARDAAQAARDRRRRWLITALASAVVVFGGLAGAAGWQWQQANDQRRLAQARQLNVQAGVAQATDSVLGLLLTVQSLNQAWSPDGHGALLAHLDDLARPQPSRWKPHPGPVRAMALSPDGRWLVTAGPGHLQAQSVDGELRDLGSRHHELYMHAVAFSADGRWLAATCEEMAACLYDAATWQMVKPLPRGDGEITSLSFGGGGRVLATGRRGAGGVGLYAVPGGDALAPLSADTASQGSTLGFSADGRRIAVVSGNQVALWDFSTRKRLGQTSGEFGMSIAMSPDGRHVAVAGRKFPQRFALSDSADSADSAATLTRQADSNGAFLGDPFSRVAFSADGRYLAATSSATGVVAVLETLTGRLVTHAAVAAGAVIFSADQRLIVAGLDGRVSAWNPDAKSLRVISQASDVSAVALSADGRQLASASADDLVRIFDTATGRETRQWKLACDAQGLAFSADGRWLAAVDGKTLRLVELANSAGGTSVKSFVHEARVLGVAFDGGKQLLTSTASRIEPQGWLPGRNRVWDIEAQSELGWRVDDSQNYDAQRQRHRGVRPAPSQVTEGGDAALVLRSVTWPVAYATDSINNDSTLLLPSQTWLTEKTSQGELLSSAALSRARLADRGGDNPQRAAISANGQFLAEFSGHDVSLWSLRPAELSAEACVRLPRNLTCKEWREALGAGLPYARTCPALPDPPDLAECTGKAAK